MPPRQKIKILAAAILLAQPLHWAFIWLVEEPYPAIAMPGFSYAGPPDSEPIRFDHLLITVHFANSPPQSLSSRTLLAPCPISHYPGLLHNHFNPRKLLPPTATSPERKKSPLTLFLRSILPGYRLRQANRTAPVPTPWLKQRLAELFPHQHPTAIQFQWFSHDVSPRPNSHTPPPTLLLDHTLPLEAPNP